MKICLATSWDDKLLEGIAELNGRHEDNKIYEVFGGLTNVPVGNIRAAWTIPDIEEKDAKDHIEMAHSLGIKFNYTFNTTCMGNEELDKAYHQKILNFIEELIDMGIDSMTISMPYLIELVKDEYPDVEVVSSIMCEINSVRKAKFFEEIGIDRMTIDQDINRNFDLIRRIMEAVNCDIEVITNNICLFQCPYEITHANFLGHSGEIGAVDTKDKDYSILRCHLRRISDTTELIRSPWIRPEDTKYYKDLGVEFFKVVGRMSQAENLLRISEAYLSRKSPDNLADIFFESLSAFKYLSHRYNLEDPNIELRNKMLDGFLDFFIKGKCDFDCFSCDYCEEIAKKAVSIDEKSVEKYKKAIKEMIKSVEYVGK